MLIVTACISAGVTDGVTLPEPLDAWYRETPWVGQHCRYAAITRDRTRGNTAIESRWNVSPLDVRSTKVLIGNVEESVRLMAINQFGRITNLCHSSMKNRAFGRPSALIQSMGQSTFHPSTTPLREATSHLSAD